MAQTHRARAYGRRSTPMDAMDMLTADHRTVEDLFAQYQHATDFPTQQQIAAHVFRALDLHAQLEEQVFYPAFEARAGKRGTQLVADSRLDHEKVKELILEMQLPDIEAETFAAKSHALMREVEQHIKQEEDEMFPEAEQILADQQAALRDEMADLKQQITTTPRP
jgi:hemerythrin superfamily protein